MGLSKSQMFAVMEKTFNEAESDRRCMNPCGDLAEADNYGRARWAEIRHWIKAGQRPAFFDNVRDSINKLVVVLCSMREQVDKADGLPHPALPEQVFDECHALREAGQKEYAHEDSNAFANFEDDAESVGVSREATLSIFANKHWRGIRAWINGHRSQRENVRGRINDMIVYLCLLRGMIDEHEGVPYPASR